MRPLDHLMAVAKAVGAATPVGSAIVTAINEYIPSAHDRAQTRYYESLLERVHAMDTRLNEDYVRTENFADLWKNCAFIAARTQRDEKLRAAANILSNALLKDGDPDKLPYTELDHFIRCVESLSVGAIHVLGHAVDIASHGLQRSQRRVREENVRVDFKYLRSRFPGMDHDLLMGLVGELAGFHLMHSLGSPSVRTEEYGNYPLETTPLGYRFARYVVEPGQPEESAKPA